MTRRSQLLCVLFTFWFATSCAQAGVLLNGNGLVGGLRWHAAPTILNGNERSLDGGLRYSLEGGSYEAFRDLLHWSTEPSVEEFQLAVEQSFDAWTTIDPTTGLRTDVTFVYDPATAVEGADDINDTNGDGAEIDILARDAGTPTTIARTGFDGIAQPVTLTTGGMMDDSIAIAGVDIKFNNNAGAVIASLDNFRRLLTHEIGHALGLNDLEAANANQIFIDDNYDNFSSATAAETLNNPWALSVNPFDPSESVVNLYTVINGVPGLDSPGVDLLMESQGLGVGPGNPATNLVPLTNDDYATRQFLYPSRDRGLVPTGDYSGNGIVDAADYVVWRDTLGQEVWWYGAGADGDLSGTIDEGDYDFWKQRFGDLINVEVPPQSIAAPEPTAFLLFAFGFLLAITASRRWHRRSLSQSFYQRRLPISGDKMPQRLSALDCATLLQ